MRAICKRELKAYFTSVVGWLFMASMLFFIGLYFTSYNLLYGYPVISYALISVNFLYLIAIPILSMRILAEDRRQKTDQLILTAPVSVEAVVFGKFLSMAVVFLLPMLLISLYPLVLSLYGTVGFAESYTAIFGYVLYGLACIAIGLFISSITESQVIAAVLTFGALFLTYMMSGISGMISSTGNLFTRFLSWFDFNSRLQLFFDGTFSVPGTVYFFSVIGLCLFFTCQSIQKRRFSVTTKQLKMGAYSSSLLICAAILAVAVNLVAGELPTKWRSIDVTANQLYTLTEQTEDILKALDQDVTIYVLSSEENQDSTVEKTLERYRGLTPHIQVVYKDPIVSPNFIQSYTTDPVSQGSLVVESALRSRVIDYNDLYVSDFDYTTYSTTTTGYDGEGQITSAIAYVTSEEMPKVYNIQGHGEQALEGDFLTAVEKENVELEDLTLVQQDAIPEDAAGIFLLAPQEDLSAEDTEKILTYLQNGGKALIVCGYTGQEMPNFESILSYYGVTVADGLVAEGDGDYYYQSPYYLLPQTGYSSITSTLSQGQLVFVPYAQGLSYPEEAEENRTYTSILDTSESAYSKVHAAEATTFEKEEGDIDGPFSLGLLVEETLEEGETRLAIYSSAEFFTSSADAMVSGANEKVFSGTLSTLVEHETPVSIEAKDYELAYLTVPQSAVFFVGMLVTIVLPLVLLIAGVVIWVRRRRR